MTKEVREYIEQQLADFAKRLAALERKSADAVIGQQKQLSSMARLEREVRLAMEQKTGVRLTARTNRKAV